MTNYQINLTIDTYFNVLAERGIIERDVEDIHQKDGVLHIVLKDKVIKEQIKNFNN